MWSLFRLSAVGSFTYRKIAFFFVAGLMSASVIVTLGSHSVFADTATWNGDTISYNDHTYIKESAALPGTQAGWDSYVYKPIDQPDTAFVISVKSNSDKTKEIVDAELRQYRLEGGNSYSSPGPPQQVTIAAGTGESGEASEQQKNKTSCIVPNVGWVICGVSKFIASGMDKIYDIIAQFLSVKPVSTDTESGLFQAWNIARGLANLCFIAAFLVIIYSQITTIGISNYEIKKMIPRLIVAAVLVNVSYYACGIAVDASNILGDSVNKALQDVRQSLPAPVPGAGVTELSWVNVTEWVMSGGTIAAGIFAAKAAFLGGAAAGSMDALAFLLFPILVSGALAVLIAVLVLAARQALITGLIVISPLAFVAYLLPNTERWFERWRELFATMLLVFPLFSLLFGGSQLASYIIIQNADQISVVIFAMFVQVAPLFLTPFLIRFSGSLLGKLANNASGYGKAATNRARGWADERAKARAGMGLRAAAQGRGNYWQQKALNDALEKRNRDSWAKEGEAYADAAWHNDNRYHRHHRSIGVADDYKSRGEAISNRRLEEYRRRNPYVSEMIGQRMNAEDAVKSLQSVQQAEFEEAKSEAMQSDNRFRSIHTDAMARAKQDQMTDFRTGTAKAMQRIEYGMALTANTAAAEAMAKGAGGIDIETGADSARAAALSAIHESRMKTIEEGRRLSQEYNLTASDRQSLARGETVWGTSNTGVRRAFNAQDSKYVYLSAVQDQIKNGTVSEKLELLVKTGQPDSLLHEYREIVTDSMIQGGLPQKAIFASGQGIDDIRAGRVKSRQDLLRMAATAIAKGKLSPEELLNQDKTAMGVIIEAAQAYANGEMRLEGDLGYQLPTELQRLFANAATAWRDPRINVRLGERTDEMIKLINMGRAGTAYTPGSGEELIPEGAIPPAPPPDQSEVDYNG